MAFQAYLWCFTMISPSWLVHRAHYRDTGETKHPASVNWNTAVESSHLLAKIFVGKENQLTITRKTTFLWDTLAEHSGKTRLQNTLEKHSCITLFQNTLPRHFWKTGFKDWLLQDALEKKNSWKTLLYDTLEDIFVWHWVQNTLAQNSFKTFLPDTLHTLHDTCPTHACKTFLQDMLVWHSFKIHVQSTLVWQLCERFLQDTCVRHTCKTLLYDTLPRDSC